MHLLKPGLLKTDGCKGPGQLLLTEESLFAFSSPAGAPHVAGALGGALGASIGVLGGGILLAAGVGALGGLLGALVARRIDSRKARGQFPEHLNDPEIQGLGPSVQKSLGGSVLLVKMPLAGLKAKCTRLGFVFEAEGQPSLSHSGLVHKKSILGFLREHQIDSTDA